MNSVWKCRQKWSGVHWRMFSVCTVSLRHRRQTGIRVCLQEARRLPVCVITRKKWWATQEDGDGWHLYFRAMHHAIIQKRFWKMQAMTRKRITRIRPVLYFAVTEPDIMYHGRKCRSICTFPLSWRSISEKTKMRGKCMKKLMAMAEVY